MRGIAIIDVFTNQHLSVEVSGVHDTVLTPGGPRLRMVKCGPMLRITADFHAKPRVANTRLTRKKYAGLTQILAERERKQ